MGHTANIGRLFGDPTSPLVEEGDFVLTSELPEGAGYFRILQAIAAGNQTYGAIREFAGIEIQHQLNRAIQYGIVERVSPTGENPTRTKRTLYRIADNFLAFWFRFIYRHRTDIARGLGRGVVDKVILPGLSNYMGPIWEEMSRDFIRRQVTSGLIGAGATSVGRWWSTDNSIEVDIVGTEGKSVTIAGSVKWSRTVGRRELGRLRESVAKMPNVDPNVTLVLIAREAVRGIEPSEALCYTARDFFE